MFVERRLDALKTPFVTIRSKESLRERKKAACSQAAFFFAKRRKGKENLSGKAMHDVVPTCAKTHGLKMFQFLEEG
jgi:hypothetical protein